MSEYSQYGPQNEAKILEAMRQIGPTRIEAAPKPPVMPYAPPVASPEPATAPERQRGGKRQARPEHDIQCAYFEWVRSQPGDDWRNIFAIPNGAAMKPYEAADMVKEGLSKGVPDILIACPRMTCFHGAFLEVKSEGGTVGAHQREWHRRLRRAGYYVEVCYGLEQLQEATLWYLGKGH